MAVIDFDVWDGSVQLLEGDLRDGIDNFFGSYKISRKKLQVFCVFLYCFYFDSERVYQYLYKLILVNGEIINRKSVNG